VSNPNLPVVLAIDRNRRNLEILTRFLEQQGYQVMQVRNLEEVEPMLQDQAIQLALIDISGFDKRVWQTCELLHQRQIPFFIISPRQQTTIQQSRIQQSSVASGAFSLLVKPVVIRELLLLLRQLLGGGK
jgi:DNA-binding response OmpR family regulator